MGVIQDYRDMNDAIKTHVESLKSAEDMTYSIFKMKYGVSENTCYLIGRMGEIHIASLSEKQALSMLYPNGKTINNTEPDLHGEMEIYNESAEEGATFDTYAAFLRHVIREIHDSYRELMGVNESIRFLIAQRDVMAENIMKAQNDPKYKEKKAELLAKLDQDIENETDSYKKKQLTEVKNYQGKLDTCDYVFDRINTLPGEAANIVESFFDSTKNRYIMKKATDKFRQLGLGNASATLRRYANIEEMFLEEKYGPFNNLFLFVAFRMVASARSDHEKGYAKDLIVKLNRLINHSFASDDAEKEFLKVITDFEDLFMQNQEYYEKFQTENRTWSGCKGGTDKFGMAGRIDRIYYKNDIHPCGTDSKFTGSHVYSFVLPSHAMVDAFVAGLKGDFEANSEADVEVFPAVISSGNTTIMGYDRYKEYLDIMLRETKFDNNKVIILADIAYPELDTEEYKMYMLRTSMLAEKSGYVIINICGYSDDPTTTYDFKVPSLETIDKVESDPGFYFQRLRPIYASSYSTCAVNIRSDANQVDFLILNAKENTLSEPIYHTFLEDDEMKTLPHSLKYPDDIEGNSEEESSSVETEVTDEVTMEDSEDSDAPMEVFTPENGPSNAELENTLRVGEIPSEEEDSSEVISNNPIGEVIHLDPTVEPSAADKVEFSKTEQPDLRAVAYQDENGEIHEIPGMFAEVTGSVEVETPEDDMTIDVVSKTESEPET